MAMTRYRRILVLLLIGGALLAITGLPPGPVTFGQSTEELDAYDIVELTAEVSAPRPRNPFTGSSLRATFRRAADEKRWEVDGFCDSEDGSVHRLRFMPPAPGDYRYTIEYRQGWATRSASGAFRVRDGHRRGPLRIDPEHRWHFIWEGTAEHYFFNGTTAYWLMGWHDEQVIESSLERLSGLKVNRIRVTVAGRTNANYGEPVVAGANWTPFLTPWPRQSGRGALHLIGRAGEKLGIGGHYGGLFDALANLGADDDIYHPGFDYDRFDVGYWQKFERAIRFARDRDMILSLVLDMGDSRVHPEPGSADEQRFIHYAVARFGAFSNITWDLGDDLDRYRDEAWARATGTLIMQWDPYQHLATSHPMDNAHQDRASAWFGFTSLQSWARPQHAFMLAQRRQQANTGRIIPQSNEEYGYEDHYPMWSAGPGSDSADALRRTAWEIVMAGAYQTTGESARRGTNVWPDTGGGWMNGRGDDTMTMLRGYAHMVDFFTSFDWWKADPRDDLVNDGNYCLASPGGAYAVYLPHGGRAIVRVDPGRYTGALWNARTGERTPLPLFDVAAPLWTSPPMPDSEDWALLLLRE